MSRPPRRIGLAITAGLLAFLLSAAWSQQSRATAFSVGRRAKLADLAGARQERVKGLERELADARHSLDQATRASRRSNIIGIERQIDAVASLAGSRRVRGGGIVVEMADSSLGKRSDSDAADFIIQDIDVQSVVNDLWQAGAEAIAVNDQRIVGTTAIRSAGGALLVNYRVLTSPYRIRAVGPQAGMYRALKSSAIAKRFSSWVELYHLGFSIRKQKIITIPAFTGSVRFRYAEPMKGET